VLSYKNNNNKNKNKKAHTHTMASRTSLEGRGGGIGNVLLGDREERRAGSQDGPIVNAQYIRIQGIQGHEEATQLTGQSS
jgi:hypothetical protein